MTKCPTAAEVVAAIDRALTELGDMGEFDHPISVLENIIQAEIALTRAKRELLGPKSYRLGGRTTSG